LPRTRPFFPAHLVYVVDPAPDSLGIAESLGAVPIALAKTEAVEEVLRHEPNGVAHSVDCVGLEVVNATLHLGQSIVLQSMMNVTATGGGVGVVGI
jgi:threonine dehydrogenase-like Zn-dependent dehydrogenase